jgi:hypothetical protein
VSELRVGFSPTRDLGASSPSSALPFERSMG